MTFMHYLKCKALQTSKTGALLFFPGGTSLLRVFATIHGYLFPHEAAFLYQLAKWAPGDDPVVEIGSMLGLSTICLSKGIQQRRLPAKVISIDPHLYGTEASFRYNLSRFKVESLVEVVVARAEEVVDKNDGSYRIVFIDGAHDLSSVTRDFGQWLPSLRPGGYMVLHDSTKLSQFPGPKQVAATFITTGRNFDAVGTVGSITWGRTCGGDSTWRPSIPGAAIVDWCLSLYKNRAMV